MNNLIDIVTGKKVSSRGLLAGYNILVSEFEHQSRNFDHLPTYTFGERYEPFTTLTMR